MGISVYYNKQRKNYRAQVKHKGITKTQTFTKKQAALEWAGNYLADIKKGDASGFRDTMTVAEILDYYLEHRAPLLKGSGYDQKVSIVKMLKVEPWSKLVISELKAGQLIAYRDKLLADGLAQSTVRHRLTTLSVAISYYIDVFSSDIRNPLDRVKRPEAHAGKRQFIPDPWFISMLLSTLRKGPDTDKHDKEKKQSYTAYLATYLASEIALNTGMRRGEICSLTYHNIDLPNRVIRIHPSITKNSRGRTIPINDRLNEVLTGDVPIELSRLTRPGQFPVKANTDVVPVHPQIISRTFREATQGCLHFHDLRHIFLTNLAATGLDVFSIKSISGHTTTRMLEKYVHQKDPVLSHLNAIKYRTDPPVKSKSRRNNPNIDSK